MSITTGVRLFTTVAITLASVNAFSVQMQGKIPAPTMSKEDVITNAAKLHACITAGYLTKNNVDPILYPRTHWYADKYFTEQEKKELEAIISIRARQAITVFGWGCESSLKKLLKLPLPTDEGFIILEQVP